MTKILEFPDCPYRFTLTPIKNGPGHGDSTRCLIEAQDGISMLRVGDFMFNYKHNLDTIIKPFKIGEDWYITYSTAYTKIAVAKLGERMEHIDSDIGGEGGFCPVEVAVPYKLTKLNDGDEVIEYVWTLPNDYPDYANEDYEVGYADFGFYSGCVWGDDSTYKLRYMDFSKIATERKLGVSAPFGYFELPSTGKLTDHIDLEYMHEDSRINLSRREPFTRREDGTWRDYSTRSEQQPRAKLLRLLAEEAFDGDKAKAHGWLFSTIPGINGMRPEAAACTMEGTVKAIVQLFKDKT